MIDFDPCTKIALECGRFGQINCCQRLQKLAQSPKNRQIWSHWFGDTFFWPLACLLRSSLLLVLWKKYLSLNPSTLLFLLLS